MTDTDNLSDGTYTVVVDSIDDGLATVFFEADGAAVGNAVLDAATLPEDGRCADAVLTVTVVGGTPVGWEYDADRTETRREQAQDRFDRLSERSPSDEDS